MPEKLNIQITEGTFTEMYEEYWHELYMAGKRYVNDEDIAKCLVQNVFISIWERRRELIIHTSARSYLHQALNLKVLEYYRKQEVKERYQLSNKLPETSVSNNTEQHISYKELISVLNIAVNELPQRCRQVYLMSRENGMDNKTIAAELVITEKAVEGNITRALASLRQRLKVFRS